jgi:hypothetical protein
MMIEEAPWDILAVLFRIAGLQLEFEPSTAGLHNYLVTNHFSNSNLGNILFIGKPSERTFLGGKAAWA